MGMGGQLQAGAPVSAAPQVRATTRLTHADQVLALLKKAGPKGCTTELLCQVTHRFSARISDLRGKGWAIDTVGRVGTDACHYVLKGTVDTPLPQPDLLRAPAPAPPSNDNTTGICQCGHMNAWHGPCPRTGHAVGPNRACPACDCQDYHPSF